MNYGDTYAYRIDVAINNSEALDRAQRELDELTRDLYSSDRAARRASTGYAQASKGARELGQSSAVASAGANRLQGAMGGLAGGVYQAANLIEDAQFGARGLGNNIGMLISTIGRFHPVAMALGGALQVLTIVFRDQIDAMLAHWGILDKNLIPGTKDATDAMSDMATATERVTEALKQQSAEVKAAGADVAKQFDDLSVESQNMLRQALVGQGFGDAEIRRFRQQLDNASDLAKIHIRKGIPTDLQAAIARPVEELNAAYARRWEATAAEIDRLMTEVAKGSDEARNQLEALARAAGGQELVDFAHNLQQAGKDMADAEKKAEKFVDQIERQNEALKETEEAQRNAARAAEEHTQALIRQAQVEANAREARQSEEANRQAQAFGPLLNDQIREALTQREVAGMDHGLAQHQVFQQAYQTLRRSGLGDQAAVDTAYQLVAQQNETVQQIAANVDALIGLFVGSQRQGTVARKMAETQAQQIRRAQIWQQSTMPRRNNRSNGL